MTYKKKTRIKDNHLTWHMHQDSPQGMLGHFPSARVPMNKALLTAD
jgi:hypothetical protein